MYIVSACFLLTIFIYSPENNKSNISLSLQITEKYAAKLKMKKRNGCQLQILTIS